MKTKIMLIKESVQRFGFAFLVIYAVTKCMDPLELSSSTTAELSSENSLHTMTVDGQLTSEPCGTCTYLLPADAGNIDGAKLKLKPGDVICLRGGVQYGPLRFINIEGNSDNPITITNCGGKALIDAYDRDYSIKVLHSHHFRITGADNSYGLLLRGGHLGLTLDYLATNFEIDHIEINQVGFAGIMAKTDPSCDDATIRDNFTMRDISIHDNFVHNTGGEGIYIGSSFYNKGVNLPCGNRLPHAIIGVKIYNNHVEFAGWDGIQLGAAIQGAAVHNNDIKFYGTGGKFMQNSGIQIGEGAGGLCFNNLIKDGTGNGITMLGIGDNVTAGNVIIGAGGAGIFCDDRYTLGQAFQFIDNIIINPKQQGIRLYSEKVESLVKDNLIINPPALSEGGTSTKNDFIFKQNDNVKMTEINNTFTRNISTVKGIYMAAFRHSAIDPSLERLPAGQSISSPTPLKVEDLLQGVKKRLEF